MSKTIVKVIFLRTRSNRNYEFPPKLMFNHVFKIRLFISVFSTVKTEGIQCFKANKKNKEQRGKEMLTHPCHPNILLTDVDTDFGEVKHEF